MKALQLCTIPSVPVTLTLSSFWSSLGVMSMLLTPMDGMSIYVFYSAETIYAVIWQNCERRNVISMFISTETLAFRRMVGHSCKIITISYSLSIVC